MRKIKGMEEIEGRKESGQWWIMNVKQEKERLVPLTTTSSWSKRTIPKSTSENSGLRLEGGRE